MILTLKLAFLEAGKTQRRVAAETKIPENKLSAFVQGWKEPTGDERVAIAHALGKSVDQVFGSREAGVAV